MLFMYAHLRMLSGRAQKLYKEENLEMHSISTRNRFKKQRDLNT